MPHTDDDWMKRALALAAHGERLDEDWTQTGSYLIFRLWHNPDTYEVVVSHVVHTSEPVEAP